MLLALILSSAMLLMQALIVTDRERVARVCSQLAAAVERADAAAFAEQVSERVSVRRARGDALDKDALMERFQRLREEYHVEEVRLRDMEIRVEGRSVVVELRATCRVVARSERYPSVTSRWRMRFDREGNEWRLTEVEHGRVEPLGIDVFDTGL